MRPPGVSMAFVPRKAASSCGAQAAREWCARQPANLPAGSPARLPGARRCDVGRPTGGARPARHRPVRHEPPAGPAGRRRRGPARAPHHPPPRGAHRPMSHPAARLPTPPPPAHPLPTVASRPGALPTAVQCPNRRPHPPWINAVRRGDLAARPPLTPFLGGSPRPRLLCTPEHRSLRAPTHNLPRKSPLEKSWTGHGRHRHCMSGKPTLLRTIAEIGEMRPKPRGERRSAPMAPWPKVQRKSAQARPAP